MQKGGQEGLRIVKVHFPLWSSPPAGYKNKVKRVLREAAGRKDKDLERRHLRSQTHHDHVRVTGDTADSNLRVRIR